MTTNIEFELVEVRAIAPFIGQFRCPSDLADEFIEQYVNGWAACGMKYEMIPMEKEAFSLQARFGNGASGGFSVADVVSSRLGSSLA